MVPCNMRAKYLGKQQIRHRLQLVTGSGMPGNLHSQLAKLLHSAPYFGTAGAEFFGDARAADDDGRIVAEKTHDAAQTLISGTLWRNIGASWGSKSDKEIMRERAENG